MSKQILVLGCGPAAVVAGIGLKKLGYCVTVLGVPRSHAVMEGLSDRVYQALVSSGLTRALRTVSEPVPRTAIWNAESRSANSERLVFRPEFDAALLEDLAGHGVRFEPTRVHSVGVTDQCWVKTHGAEKLTTWSADFVVDARGRSASLSGRARVRGPETVSLACCWEGKSGDPFSAVASVEKGWLWVARRSSGTLFTQFTTHASQLDLAAKAKIPAYLYTQLGNLEPGALPLGKFTGGSSPLARSSTAILVDNPVDDSCIRIGDAAMAVDPLSGNGVFQSLSSALVAPAVVNTILQRQDDAEVAKRFYRERLQILFYRFARIGRDFYSSESRWPDVGFWRDRRAWPDQLPVHPERDEVLGTGARPVVNEGFIEMKKVVLTADQPQGIWRVNGREILSG